MSANENRVVITGQSAVEKPQLTRNRRVTHRMLHAKFYTSEFWEGDGQAGSYRSSVGSLAITAFAVSGVERRSYVKVFLLGATSMVGQGVLRRMSARPEVESTQPRGEVTPCSSTRKLHEVVDNDLSSFSAIEGRPSELVKRCAISVPCDPEPRAPKCAFSIPLQNASVRAWLGVSY